MEGMDESFDFVVVGSGGGSMCAGLVMREAGKSVAILEKTDLIGGSTARSGGVMWIPNNPFMRADGVHDSYDQALTYMNATAGQSENAPGSTAERRSTYVSKAPEMVRFLVDQGIKLRRMAYWPDYYDERPGGSAAGRTVVAELFNAAELGAWRTKLRPNWVPLPGTLEELFALPFIKRSWKSRYAALRVGIRSAAARLTGKHWVPAGAALQGRMLKRAIETGVEIRLNSGVSSLIVEEGVVTGVVTTRGGQNWKIGAKLGVLINAGGFAHNQELRDRFIPGTSARWTAASPGDTGEMLLELMRLGAATGQLDERVGNQMVIPPGQENENGDGLVYAAVSSQMDIAKPHSILVDQTGIRYMNECGSYMAFCQNMFKRNEDVPAVPSWWIVDDTYMQTYMFCGTLPGSAKPQAWYDSGFLKKADTIDELAGLCGMEPQALRSTIDRFNAEAEFGRDPEFHRGARKYDNWLGDPFHQPSKTLGPISRGPFYAAHVTPGDVGTFGGVVTDVYGRVLRTDGQPIPGLYATGNTTASVMGRYYPGAGSSIGPAFTWGYVAARHAASLTD